MGRWLGRMAAVALLVGMLLWLGTGLAEEMAGSTTPTDLDPGLAGLSTPTDLDPGLAGPTTPTDLHTVHQFEDYFCTICGAMGGKCGPTMDWLLKDGVMILSGSGDWYESTITKPNEPYDWPWLAYADTITELVIESGVKRIGGYAFWGCTELESVTIPASVTKIEDAAFADCYSLREVNFVPGSNLQIISYLAFNSCVSLERIVFPARVRQIAISAFANCYGLTEVVFEPGSQLISLMRYAFDGLGADGPATITFTCKDSPLADQFALNKDGVRVNMGNGFTGMENAWINVPCTWDFSNLAWVDGDIHRIHGNYVDGVCEQCGERCVHPEGVTDGLCPICGLPCGHDVLGGGEYEANFAFDAINQYGHHAVCRTCGEEIQEESHLFDDGVCRYCGFSTAVTVRFFDEDQELIVLNQRLIFDPYSEENIVTLPDYRPKGGRVFDGWTKDGEPVDTMYLLTALPEDRELRFDAVCHAAVCTYSYTVLEDGEPVEATGDSTDLAAVMTELLCSPLGDGVVELLTDVTLEDPICLRSGSVELRLNGATLTANIIGPLFTVREGCIRIVPDGGRIVGMTAPVLPDHYGFVNEAGEVIDDFSQPVSVAWLLPYAIHYMDGDGQCMDCDLTYDELSVGMTQMLILPEEVREIEAEAFAGADVQTVIVPDGCLRIGSGAFRNCANLTYLVMSAGTELASDAVAGSGLAHLIIK